jgi:hypothetical protein
MKTFTTIILTLSICGIVYLIPTPKPVAATPQEATQLPQFASGVEGVEIVAARIVKETAGEAVEVTIQNNTPRKVIAVQLWCGTTGNARGIGTVENPMIPPNGGQFTMRFQVANLTEGKPLAVSAVVWDDETGSGYPFQSRNFERQIQADIANRKEENQ